MDLYTHLNYFKAEVSLKYCILYYNRTDVKHLAFLNKPIILLQTAADDETMRMHFPRKYRSA